MKRTKTNFSSDNASLSKLNNWFLALFIGCFAVFCFSDYASAKDLKIRLKISENSNVVKVEGSFQTKKRVQFANHFAFLNSVASDGQISERISNLLITDEIGQPLKKKRVSPGEYLIEGIAANWAYDIEAKTAPDIIEKARNSWILDNTGLLMLADLLPQFQSINGIPISASVQFDVPDGWTIITSAANKSGNVYEIRDFETSVFAVGIAWRDHNVSLEGVDIRLLIAGEWRFTDAEAADQIRQILPEFKAMYGEYPIENVLIAVVPVPESFGRWSAETRGSNVTIVSGDMPFEKLSRQRLHEQLRHELLHLWIPNALALSGNYDWFYEGFIVYQALRTGVAVGRLSFEDFLFTLSGAYDIANSRATGKSLVDGSKSGKSGTNQLNYSKGMLVAFFCDVTLLSKSKGKRSVADILKQVYFAHRVPNETKDANDAILKIISSHPELQPIIADYITGTKMLEWNRFLDVVGLTQISDTNINRLKVGNKLSVRQKELLDKLGYNNWRKIGRK